MTEEQGYQVVDSLCTSSFRLSPCVSPSPVPQYVPFFDPPFVPFRCFAHTLTLRPT